MTTFGWLVWFFGVLVGMLILLPLVVFAMGGFLRFGLWSAHFWGLD